MPDRSQPYDLAVSFAGAQRDLAERFVRACEALGLDVFYDKNVTAEMWGRNFIFEFRRVYGGELARYVVPFLSVDYFTGPYPMDEFSAAVAHSLQRGHDPYLLPITVGDVRIPENLLSSAIGHLRAEDHSVEELARIAAARVRGDRAPAAPPPAPTSAGRVRLPRVAPAGFSEFGTLESALARIGEKFRQHERELEPFGYACHVRVTDNSVDVRVEEHGRQTYGLAVRLGDGDGFGRDQLTVRFGWPRISTSGVNGWATAEFDAQSGEGRLKYFQFTSAPDRLLSADEFFDALWAKIVDHIEQTHGRRV